MTRPRTYDPKKHEVDTTKDHQCLCGEPLGECPGCGAYTICSDVRCPNCDFSLR